MLILASPSFGLEAARSQLARRVLELDFEPLPFRVCYPSLLAGRFSAACRFYDDDAHENRFSSEEIELKSQDVYARVGSERNRLFERARNDCPCAMVNSCDGMPVTSGRAMKGQALK